MKVGDIVCLSSVPHRGTNISVTYSMEKGYLGSFLFLGASKKDDAPSFDVERAMRRLGWAPVSDEWAPEAIERAAKAFHEARRKSAAETAGVNDDNEFDVEWEKLDDEIKELTRGWIRAALEVV